MENLRNESLIVRNEVIKKINNELNVDFSYSFNDLYWVNNKKVEVRRLKGYLSNNEVWYNSNIEKYNDKFEEVKKFIESLEYKDFKIELNKLDEKVSRKYYERNFDFNKNLSYKEYCNEIKLNERCLILKISYNI
jgi:RNA binding exosome subunit